MNDRVFVIRTDHALHERIRKLAYLANTSCSAAIRTLLKQQDEEEQLSVLLRGKKWGVSAPQTTIP